MSLLDLVNKAIVYSDNPFISSATSTQEKTISSIAQLKAEYKTNNILEKLYEIEEELTIKVNSSEGSITAREIILVEHERLWNCRAAIKYLKS